MLHSMAGQVEYLIALIDTLQDLVQLMIEYIYFNKEKLAQQSVLGSRGTAGTTGTRSSKQFKQEVEVTQVVLFLCNGV